MNIKLALGALASAVLGLALVLFASPGVDPKARDVCRATYAQNADVIARCDQPAFAAAVASPDAVTAAQAIGSINTGTTILEGIGYFFLGLALVSGVGALRTGVNKPLSR